jgi:hypothetical protein
MTAKELAEYLVQDAGLDAPTVEVIMKGLVNDKVNAKAQTLLQKKDYDELERRAAALELSYNGTPQRPGSKAYEEWYAKNKPAIEELQRKAAIYEERFGPLDPNTPVKPSAAAAAATTTFNAEDVQKIVNETIQNNYAPRWSDLLTNTGSIVQKHMRSGRKTDIDFKKLGEIAATKNGDLMAAYDEWDAPERQAAEKTQTESEIKRRVDEELAKRQTPQFFPAGADATPSTQGITRSTADRKYDRNKVVEAAVTGKYEPAVQ